MRPSGGFWRAFDSAHVMFPQQSKVAGSGWSEIWRKSDFLEPCCNGHKFEQSLGDGKGQGILAC